MTEAMTDYDFLNRMRDILMPAAKEASQNDVLGREVSIDRVVPGDERLFVASYNGPDRIYRCYDIPIADLRADFIAAYKHAVTVVLPVTSVQLEQVAFNGMTRRDWFAGQAIAGALANGDDYESADWDNCAAYAYKLADAMLVARNKKED